MDVVFYNFKYKKNDINKVIPSGTTVSCEIKDGASIEAPVLYMRKNDNIINSFIAFNDYFIGCKVNNNRVFPGLLAFRIIIKGVYKNEKH